LRADYVVSNPPFNDSGWGEDRINYDDPRFKYGVPPDNNGNYAWIQHYIYHEDEIPFEEKMKSYSEELSKLLKEEEELTKKVKEVFKILGFDI
ncbi:MAG: N-6 DNA methylase, partial [candidate division WOR-3 bacterium]